MTDLHQMLRQAIQQRGLTTSGQLHEFRQSLIHQLNQFFTDELTGAAAAPDHISASIVTLEVVDETSGRIYRRQLPLDFYENDNGIRLRGETLTGQETEIAFLSARALAKLHDLTGHGPDSDHCGGHSPSKQD